MKPEKSSTTTVPDTYSDTFEAGIEEEESGDRWIISDISKTIRFYSKAIDYYTRSIELNPSGPENFDAWFNKSRLNFHVYSILKDINITADTTNVNECGNVLNLSLNDISNEHEDIIRRFNDDDRIINWDFYYDYGLVLIELIETEDTWNTFEELENIVQNGIQLFNKVLDLLLAELDRFLINLDGGSEENSESQPIEVNVNNDNNNNSEGSEEYTMIEQVTPKVVFDSVLTSLKFAQVSFEATENQIQLEYFKSLFAGLLKRCGEIRNVLVEKFDTQSVNKFDDGLKLSTEDLLEFELVKHSIEALFINDFKSLTTYWDSIMELSYVSEYLSEADSLENYRQHFVNNEDYELQWEVIGTMNKLLSTAQGLIQKDLQKEINLKSSLISNNVSKSVEVLIMRADNELRRLQLSETFNWKSDTREVLSRNIVSLLKNGLSISQTRCGLRETILDKLKREKLGRECVIRLVLITKRDYTEEDLIRNLGNSYYKAEINDVKQNENYAKLIH